MRLAIFGCGGMGREAADIARRISPDADLVFVTDQGGPPVDGVPHFKADRLDDRPLVLAVGDPEARRRLAERFASERAGMLVARTAVVAPSATLGEGAIVAEYACINNAARAGRHLVANVYSHVSHDSILGDYVTLSPHASCNGWVEIGDGAFIGAGAVIRNGTPHRRLKIGAGAVVAAGAIVVRDVAPGETVMGVRAR